MIDLYWGCLIAGVLFTLVTVVAGDFISNLLDGALDFLSLDFLKPVTLGGAVTSFGGAGILLTTYSAIPWPAALTASLVIAVCTAIASYYVYVRPMRNAETSTAFSHRGLIGRTGEVIVPVPAAGCGEVLLSTVGGVTNQIAESFDGEPIQGGTKVVVVETRDGALLVSPLDTNPLKGD